MCARPRSSFFGGRGVLLACAALGIGAAACGAILGVQDGVLDTDGGADASPQMDATQADVLTATDAGPGDTGVPDAGDGSTEEAGIPCADRTVNVNTGVFVAQTGGTDQPSCGSIASPCSTLQMGITQAQHSGATTVYVATGTYEESIAVPSGLTIVGTSGWTPVCGIAAVTAVSIEMPDGGGTVVTVAADAGSVTLRYLGILGNAQPAAAGQSLYGIFGPGAAFTLDTIAVTMGSGGAGATGNIGATDLSAPNGCPEGTGASGGAASNTPPPAPPGTFGPNGYVPGTGATGASDGGSGSAGGCSPPLIQFCSCGVSCALPLSGCGGFPGQGGIGGQGGGSSIGVYGWNSAVTIVGGTYLAGNGGNGGNGGDGGPGGAGGGESAESCTCTGFGPQQYIGGPGGAGGPGGRGGGGAGGFSYAIFLGGDAGTLTLLSAPTLGHGEAGAGGSFNGTPGQAGDEGPLPPVEAGAGDAAAGDGAPSDAAPDDGG
jgi:hypothetical protein